MTCPILDSNMGSCGRRQQAVIVLSCGVVVGGIGSCFSLVKGWVQGRGG